MCKAESIEELFEKYLELQSNAEREQSMRELQSKDATLHKKLEQLVRAHKAAGSFLDVSTDSFSPTLEHALGDLVGSQIGPYKLLQQLGEGGMGVVYMAERQRTDVVGRRAGRARTGNACEATSYFVSMRSRKSIRSRKALLKRWTQN